MSFTFGRCVLRTTDVPGAAAFYAAVLGARSLELTSLPELARARGARSHWLGHVGVDDVEAEASAWIAAGAQRLGGSADGAVVLRDAGGALFALSTPAASGASPAALHVHRAQDSVAHAERYAARHAWALGPKLTVAGVTFHGFTWRAGGPLAGLFGELTAGVHPQWLHFFAVPSLDDAVAAVRSGGGLALPPFSLEGGRRGAACDDPQGAAFGLLEA